MNHDTKPSPPPPLTLSEAEALGERIGEAIKEAVGGPLPELPRPLQYIVGRVLLRLGLEVLSEAKVSKGEVLMQIRRWERGYECSCPGCEAQRAKARCTTKGGSA